MLAPLQKEKLNKKKKKITIIPKKKKIHLWVNLNKSGCSLQFCRFKHLRAVSSANSFRYILSQVGRTEESRVQPNFQQLHHTFSVFMYEEWGRNFLLSVLTVLRGQFTVNLFFLTIITYPITEQAT